MKLTETKHHASDGSRIHTGMIRVGKWTGTVIVSAYTVEVLMVTSGSQFKAYKEFTSYEAAKEFALSMDSRYSSLRALTLLGFDRFH